MQAPCSFVDLHCHLLPGIDDGAADVETSLAMARMAVADGTYLIVTTPHQLGNFSQNRGDQIRRRVAGLQQQLDAAEIPLSVLPGADVRIDDGMVEALAAGDVLTLADRGRHVLLELPHELYFPIEGLLDRLAEQGMTGILSHPERNAGLLERKHLVSGLVEAGCLMQVTAGSLVGTFGSRSQRLAEWMLREGLVHFIATDAHGHQTRRPLMRRAFQRVEQLMGPSTAVELCSESPRLVACGESTPVGRRKRRLSRIGRLLLGGKRS